MDPLLLQFCDVNLPVQCAAVHFIQPFRHIPAFRHIPGP